MPNENDALNTPVMKQFQEVKAGYPDAILFFRMGDFYEMFLDDAIKASAILDIALTKRQNQIPMCGIPYHSSESYISRLLSAGENIVICEQKASSDPKAKLMQREVVRVITPGTVIEDNLLSGFSNNFLCIVYFSFNEVYMAFADVSTSDLYYLAQKYENLSGITTTLAKFLPSEIIVPSNQYERFAALPVFFHHKLTKTDYIAPQNPSGRFVPLQEILQQVLQKNFRENPFQFKTAVILDDTEYLGLDEQTVRNLELVENKNEESHTLFHVLNFCKTPKGKRILKQRILFPSRNRDVIESRWQKTDSVSSEKKTLAELKNLLSSSADLERIISRFRAGKAYPRDFRTIAANIEIAFALQQKLSGKNYPFRIPEKPLQNLVDFIQERLSADDLPAVLGNGMFLRPGFNEKLDKARNVKTNNKDLILQLEAEEKQKTGLSTLKIKYNKVVGYFVELSRNQGESAPKHFIKKQTLVSSERFSFPELEELERNILQADEIIQQTEKEEFERMVEKTLEFSDSLMVVSEETGELDFIISLHEARENYRWTRPVISANTELSLKDSRHPVIEKFLPIGEHFVPNDIRLDSDSECTAILTGPNMAGKSTFMRQVGLIQILFQMGASVPAREASMFIADRVFTRIGSGDNLTAGESTFFVEMKESAYILSGATENSILLFDEVGRGTSTYDGLSIAWAILEYLNNLPQKPKAIFSTHYHELTELEKEKGIFNLFLDTREKDGEVLFLKKVKKGKANKSFGIYVARIAGMPQAVVSRAGEILAGLESGKKRNRENPEQLMLFAATKDPATKEDPKAKKIMKKLGSTDPDKITPMQALEILQELKSLL